MQRLNTVNPEFAEGRTKQLFAAVEQSLGVIPNTAKVMANSPSVLDSFLGFNAAMGEAKIGTKLHNLVKLTTSETNSCDYCTSILTAVAPSVGLSTDEILAGRIGYSLDGRSKAALAFANDVLESQGKVNDLQLAAVRDAGFDDGEIVEIVASVVLGCFTNFLNNVADTELDIPKAEPVAAYSTSNCSSGACSVH